MMDIYQIGRFFLFITIFSFINYPEVQWKRMIWKDSWQEIQQARRQRVWDTCSKYPELQKQELDYGFMYFSHEYSLMYCALGKVGTTTTFLTTFRQILVGEEWTEYARG